MLGTVLIGRLEGQIWPKSQKDLPGWTWAGKGLTRKDTWVLDCRINNSTRLGGTQSDCKQLEEVYENAKKQGKQQHAKKKDGRNWIMTDIV